MAKQERAADSPTKRILLIAAEDAATLYAQALTEQGYEVTTAQTAKEYSDAILNHEFDLVISTNLNIVRALPDDVVPLIRRLHPRTRILVYTGYNPPGYASKIIEQGADWVMQAPVPFKELMSKVRELTHGNDERTCPNCGKVVLQDNKFCASCGERLETGNERNGKKEGGFDREGAASVLDPIIQKVKSDGTKLIEQGELKAEELVDYVKKQIFKMMDANFEQTPEQKAWLEIHVGEVAKKPIGVNRGVRKVGERATAQNFMRFLLAILLFPFAVVVWIINWLREHILEDSPPPIVLDSTPLLRRFNAFYVKRRYIILPIVVALFVFATIASIQYFKPQSVPTNPVIGSKDSNVYHTWDCLYARTIDGDNLIQFDSPEQASARSYRPCKRCITKKKTLEEILKEYE